MSYKQKCKVVSLNLAHPVYTPCPRKNYNTIYVAITLANNVGFQRNSTTTTLSLNCKQVTKFQQNGSTSATATASLVRSLKSIKFHYRHRRDWLSSVRPCKWQDVSTLSLCSRCPPCARSRTQAPRRGRHCLTDSSMTTWRKCSHSSIRRDFSWSTSRIWLR